MYNLPSAFAGSTDIGGSLAPSAFELPLLSRPGPWVGRH